MKFKKDRKKLKKKKRIKNVNFYIKIFKICRENMDNK